MRKPAIVVVIITAVSVSSARLGRYLVICSTREFLGCRHFLLFLGELLVQRLDLLHVLSDDLLGGVTDSLDGIRSGNDVAVICVHRDSVLFTWILLEDGRESGQGKVLAVLLDLRLGTQVMDLKNLRKVDALDDVVGRVLAVEPLELVLLGDGARPGGGVARVT